MHITYSPSHTKEELGTWLKRLAPTEAEYLLPFAVFEWRLKWESQQELEQHFTSRAFSCRHLPYFALANRRCDDPDWTLSVHFIPFTIIPLWASCLCNCISMTVFLSETASTENSYWTPNKMCLDKQVHSIFRWRFWHYWSMRFPLSHFKIKLLFNRTLINTC